MHRVIKAIQDSSSLTQGWVVDPFIDGVVEINGRRQHHPKPFSQMHWEDLGINIDTDLSCLIRFTYSPDAMHPIKSIVIQPTNHKLFIEICTC